MTGKRNVLSFAVSFLLAIVFIIYSAAVIANNAGLMDGVFSYENGIFTVFGKEYIIEESLCEIADSYFSVCGKFFDSFIPKALSVPAKKSAEALSAAFVRIFEGAAEIMSYLVYGNM